MTPATLKCPDCGSHNVTCESTTVAHTHYCEDCSRLDVWAPVKK